MNICCLEIPGDASMGVVASAAGDDDNDELYSPECLS